MWISDYLLFMNIWCDAITHRASWTETFPVFCVHYTTMHQFYKYSVTSFKDTCIHRVHESELMTFWSTTKLELVETHCCVKILTKMSNKVSNRSPGQSFDSNYQQMKEMFQNIHFYYIIKNYIYILCVMWCCP